MPARAGTKRREDVQQSLTWLMASRVAVHAEEMRSCMVEENELDVLCDWVIFGVRDGGF